MIKNGVEKVDGIMGVTVFLHYYIPSDRFRAEENKAVFMEWISNRYIDRLVVIRKPEITAPARPDVEIQLNAQPLLRDYREAIAQFSGNDDITIVPNADCFIAEEDMLLLNDLKQGTAYCLSRVEIKSVRPIKLYWWRNRSIRRKHPLDSQDCWIFRGILKPDMWLEFPLGKPGSDNRLAFEFEKAGYRIFNPASSIRLFHFHRSKTRSYTEADRIPPPYAFPERN